jgi:LacI family transcriptional regulator
LAADDTTAIGALSAAWDQGIAVPADLSIIGYDDVRIAGYVRPALTTVRQPIEEIGRRAVEMLVGMVRGEATGDTLPHVLLEPELVIRDSCGPPAA